MFFGDVEYPPKLRLCEAPGIRQSYGLEPNLCLSGAAVRMHVGRFVHIARVEVETESVFCEYGRGQDSHLLSV